MYVLPEYYARGLFSLGFQVILTVYITSADQLLYPALDVLQGGFSTPTPNPAWQAGWSPLNWAQGLQQSFADQ